MAQVSVSWDSMTTQERDAWIAEWLGQDCLARHGYIDRLPSFATEYAAAKLMLDEVERRGLHDTYQEELLALLAVSPVSSVQTHAVWEVFHANPKLWRLIDPTWGQLCETVYRVAAKE